MILNHDKRTGPQELELRSDSTVLKACERIFLEASHRLFDLLLAPIRHHHIAWESEFQSAN